MEVFGLFSVVIGGDMIERSKPDTVIFYGSLQTVECIA